MRNDDDSTWRDLPGWADWKDAGVTLFGSESDRQFLSLTRRAIRYRRLRSFTTADIRHAIRTIREEATAARLKGFHRESMSDLILAAKLQAMMGVIAEQAILPVMSEEEL